VNVLGIAADRHGKTAGYVLPMLARLERRTRASAHAALADPGPTRELAAQVEQSFEKYGHQPQLSVALLIGGGLPPTSSCAKLDRGVDVLIAHARRLLDHFGRGKIL